MPRLGRLETVEAEHMSKLSQRARRVALFVEGDTERGEARRRTLSAFFHGWLDPQLPPASKVGITPVKFQGVSNYYPGTEEAHTNPTRQRGECLRALAGASG